MTWSSDSIEYKGFVGQIAQSVEQRTENPRVGGSIPPLATKPLLWTLDVVDVRSFVRYWMIINYVKLLVNEASWQGSLRVG